MSSEALERAQTALLRLHGTSFSEDGKTCPACAVEDVLRELDAALAVARERAEKAEQERDHHEHEAAEWRKALLSENSQRSQAAYDAMAAALAVAREREQRHRGALQQIANHNVRAPVTGTSADDPCDWHCTAQQRDLARAALVDEPAAAIGKQAVDDYRQDLARLAEAQTVASVGQPPAAATLAEPGGESVRSTLESGRSADGGRRNVASGAVPARSCPPGSASAAADEPGETP